MPSAARGEEVRITVSASPVVEKRKTGDRRRTNLYIHGRRYILPPGDIQDHGRQGTGKRAPATKISAQTDAELESRQNFYGYPLP